MWNDWMKDGTMEEYCSVGVREILPVVHRPSLLSAGNNDLLFFLLILNIYSILNPGYNCVSIVNTEKCNNILVQK